MNDDTKGRLERIKALVEKATPGPWFVPRGQPRHLNQVGPRTLLVNSATAGFASSADFKFVAAAREAVPWLVSEVERLQQFEPPSIDKDAPLPDLNCLLCNRWRCNRTVVQAYPGYRVEYGAHARCIEELRNSQLLWREERRDRNT